MSLEAETAGTEDLRAHVERERSWVELYDHERLVHRISGEEVPADLAEAERLHAELHTTPGDLP